MPFIISSTLSLRGGYMKKQIYIILLITSIIMLPGCAQREQQIDNNFDKHIDAEYLIPTHIIVKLQPGIHKLSVMARWNCTFPLPLLTEAPCASWCIGDIQFTSKAGGRYYFEQDDEKRPVEITVHDYTSDELVSKEECNRGCNEVFNFAPEDACAKQTKTPHLGGAANSTWNPMVSIL